MFTALTKDNKRVSIEEAVPGENYLCPVCGNPVVVKAVKSDSVRTHFAHKRNSLCIDDWKHDMSEWHFEWQSKFPIDSREVVVERDGVVHRADILINDTVIEFQHSRINGEEFEARNSFYKNCGYRVVWLFDVADKMRFDDCFGLVWKRKTTRFSSMKTPIDGLFIQNYLPGKDDLRRVKQVDPKEVPYYETICPIMPENFLKEFGVTQDENVLSIQAIFEKTREQINAYNRMKRELAEQQRRAGANAAFNQLIRGTNRRHGQF